MSLFKKHKAEIQPIPEPFTVQDIRVESSICTGEKTIGFLARSEQDVRDFLARYEARLDAETLRKLITD